MSKCAETIRREGGAGRHVDYVPRYAKFIQSESAARGFTSRLCEDLSGISDASDIPDKQGTVSVSLFPSPSPLAHPSGLYKTSGRWESWRVSAR